MRHIWKIFKEDMKNIATNWVVLVLIGGLVILPSLYAWFNIKASWDPYGQTDQIPIGVVNKDKGTTVRGEDIDVGNELVDSLKGNKSMNWQFVDEKRAMEEVEYGNYFATIIIPDDFSEKLATVVSGHPEKAEMNYYVNEKINAIAPKITDKGASVIVEEISSEFISTVNGVIFDMFNQIGLELEKDLPDIEQFKEYIFTLEDSLPDIHDVLTSTNSDATEAKRIIEEVLGKIPETKQQTNEGLETLHTTLAHVENAEKKFNEISPKITEDLKIAQTIVHDVNNVLEKAKEQGSISDTIENELYKTKEGITTSKNKLKEVNTLLSKMQEQIEKENTENQDEENNLSTEDIEKAKAEINELILMMESMNHELAALDGIGDAFDDKLDEINDISKASTDKVDTFINEYTDTIAPAISNALKGVEEKLVSAKSLVLDIQQTIPKAEKLLHSTNDNLHEGQEMIQYVLGEFPYVQDKVKETANKIRSLEKETNLNDIIDLLKNDPDAEQGFFAEPVVLNKNELFPIENYGTGMTPFYTVLAIWVGALLLISLLSTDLPEAAYTAKEMYAGRLLTFLSIGLLQTIIVTLGDMFLLGVTVSNPVWFVIFGICISVTFMLIVYTVVSLLGDVGKATAIVLLVLQIAGSGGTYPVVLLPPFFQAINPFLPFTYAVDLMREAVGGIVWGRVLHDILFLSIFAVIFILLGIFLKKPLNQVLHKMMASKGSRLFH